MKRPVDFFSTNYLARVDVKLCKGCGKCSTRCQMEAVHLKNNRAHVDQRRCIGCGVCVPTCPTGAIALVKKKKEIVPPETEEDYFEVLAAKKKGKLQKRLVDIKTKMGIPL
jgi:MinD superfamily P-loop ATPase